MDLFIEQAGNEAFIFDSIEPVYGIIDINYVWNKGIEFNNPVSFFPALQAWYKVWKRNYPAEE